MPKAPTSYPRKKIRILLLENISDSAVDEFKKGGYVEVRKLNGALTEDQLMRAVRGVHLIGIRSKTQITKNVVDAADKLLAIGCFCIGVNQVDLRAATEHGVAVFNAAVFKYPFRGGVDHRPVGDPYTQDRGEKRCRA